MDDSSPRNAGYDPHEAKWKVIDAGCYKVARGVRPLASVWEGFRNGMHRFNGTYSGTNGFLELLDSVMGGFLASRSVEIFNDEIASVLTGRASEAFAARPKSVLVAAQGLPSTSLAAQALRQGEEAGERQWAAARDVGARFLKGPPGPGSATGRFDLGLAQEPDSDGAVAGSWCSVLQGVCRELRLVGAR